MHALTAKPSCKSARGLAPLPDPVRVSGGGQHQHHCSVADTMQTTQGTCQLLLELHRHVNGAIPPVCPGIRATHFPSTGSGARRDQGVRIPQLPGGPERWERTPRGANWKSQQKKPNIKNAREQKRTRERVRLEPPSPDPIEAYTLVSIGRSIARVAGLGESRLPKERGCPCCDGEESHCKPKAASVQEKGKKSLCPCLAQQNGTRSHRKTIDNCLQ